MVDQLVDKNKTDFNGNLNKPEAIFNVISNEMKFYEKIQKKSV